MAKIKTVRVVKTLYGTYSLQFTTPDGRRRRLSVGSDLHQSQKLALKFSDWLIDGKDPEQELAKVNKAEQVRAISIRDFFPVFIQRHGSLQSISMQKRYQVMFKNICRCPEIADSGIGSLRKSLMLDYMHARIKLDKVAMATVNREAAFVKGMLSRAVEWDMLEVNPLVGLRLFREAGKRNVNLSQEDARRLISSLPPPVDDIVEFAIYTGFRRENILGLKIGQVRLYDLKPGGEVDLVVKGGRAETFPLGALAAEILKRNIGSRTSGYVFPNPDTGNRYTDLHRTFDRAVRKLGLVVEGTKLRFHDLRHVFATWLHQEGVTLDVLRPLLGHRQRATTDRYATFDRMAVGQVLSLLPNLRSMPAVKEERTRG